MKKLACSLLTIIILFTISCEIGLGSSVDTEPPALAIDASLVDTVIADDFNIEGTYSDDGSIHDIKAILKRTDGYGSEIEIQGIFKEDLKKRGSGTWAIPVEAKSKNIVDGSYQATVYITDSLGRVTTQSTTFTIDNTPPVLILTKPNSKPGDETVSAYGQRLFLEGNIADTAKETFIEVEFYDNADFLGEPRKVIKTSAIAPTDVNSNNAKLTVYKEEAYDTIYNPLTPQGKEGSKNIYIKITASDLAGNKTSDFYFSKDLAKNLTKSKESNDPGAYGLAAIDIYNILNGTDALKNIERSADDVDTIVELLAENAKQEAMFSLNPANSPYFTVSGMKTLTKSGKDFESADNGYFVIQGAQTLEVSVFMGSDSIELVDDEEFYVYLLECNENGEPIDENGAVLNEEDDNSNYRIKLYTKSKETGSGINKKTYYSKGGKQTHKTTSGAYVFTVPMNKTIIYDPDVYDARDAQPQGVATQNIEIGKNYLIRVNGKDNEDNPVEPYETGYGFHLSSGGGAPVLSITEPSDHTAFYKKGEGIVFKGTAKSEEGVPEITVWDGDEKIATIPLETEIDGEVNEFNYTIPASVYTKEQLNKSKIYSLVVRATQGDGKAESSYSIWYDVDAPDIKINSIQPVITVDNKKCINGTLKINGTIIDSFDQVGSATYKVVQNGESGEETMLSGDLENSFELDIDTTKLVDKKDAKIIIEASDRVGNLGLSNTKTETLSYYVDQSTDKPIIKSSSASLVITEGSDESILDDGKNLYMRGGTMILSVSDDDSVQSALVMLGKKKDDGTFDVPTSNSSNTANPLYQMYSNPSVISHSLPNDLGVYLATVIVQDENYVSETSTPNNYSKTQFIIRVTGTGPDVTITPEKDYISTLSAAGTNTLTFEIVDEGNGPYTLLKDSEMQFNGATKESPFEYTITYPMGTTSVDEIRFRVMDKNSSFTEKLYKPKFDNVLPEVSITSIPTKELTEDTSYLFRGEMSDTLSGVATIQLKFMDGTDESEWIEGILGSRTWNCQVEWASDGIKDVFTTDGEKTVIVKATDGAGNSKEISENFVYDKIKPEVVSITETGKTTTPETINGTGDLNLTITIMDSNPIKPQVLIKQNGAAIVPSVNLAPAAPTAVSGSANTYTSAVTIPFSTAITTDGVYEIEVIAKDESGKSSTAKSIKITRDSSKPVVTNVKMINEVTGEEVYYSNGKYYINNTKDTYKISGIAADNIGVDSVNLEITKNGSTDKITKINSGTSSQWQFTGINLSTWTATGATAKLEIKDTAGNVADQNVTLNIVFDTEAPTATHEIDDKLKDIVFRIGDYANDAGEADVGGKYSNNTYGSALTIQIRGLYEDTENGSGVNKYYYKVFNLETIIDDTKTNEQINDEETQIYFKDLDSLAEYVIANKTDTFSPLAVTETRNVEYNITAGENDRFNGTKITTKSGYDQYRLSNVKSNFKSTIKGFQEGKNYLVLVAEDNVGNTSVDFAVVPNPNDSEHPFIYPCYSLNVDITAPSIPQKNNGTVYSNAKETQLLISGTVSDKPGAPNGSSGIKEIVFTNADYLDANGKAKTITVSASSLTSSPTATDATLCNWNVNIISLIDPTKNNANISAKVVDNAGYETSALVANVSVDTEGPTIAIHSPAADTKTNTSITLKGSANDGNGAGINIDDEKGLTLYYTTTPTLGASAPTDETIGSWVAATTKPVLTAQNWTCTFDASSVATPGEDTNVYFVVGGEDTAGTGNKGYSAPVKVVVDRKAPSIESIEVEDISVEDITDNTWFRNKTLNVTGTATDTASGVTAIKYQIKLSTDAEYPETIANVATNGEFSMNLKDYNSANHKYDLDFEDKVHSFKVWAVDEVGNASEPVDYTLQVDTTLPEIISGYNAGNIPIDNNSAEKTVTITVKDINGSGISSVKLDVGTASATKNDFAADVHEQDVTIDIAAALTAAGGGTQLVSATVTDRAGNVSTKNLGSLFYDDEKPSISIINLTATNSSVTLSGSANDGAGSGIKKSEGITFYYTTSSSLAAEVPTTETIGDNPAEKWKQVSDAEIVNSKDYPPSITWEHTFDVTGITTADQNNTLYFSASVEDGSGNVGYSTPESVLVDREKPSMNFNVGSESGTNLGASTTKWFNNTNLNLTGTATDNTNGSGIKKIVYKVKKQGATNYADPVDVATDGEFDVNEKEFAAGTNKITVWAVDKAGNTSTETEYTIKIDKIAPEITSDSITVYSNGVDACNISVAAQDETNGSNIASVVLTDGTNVTDPLTINAGVYSADVREWFSSLASEKTVSISAIVTDVAGNEKKDTVAIITIDKTGPELTITTPSLDDTFSSDSVILAGTITDGAGKGVKSNTFKLYYTTSSSVAENPPTAQTISTTANSAWVLATTGTGSGVSGQNWTCTFDAASVASEGANTPIYFVVGATDDFTTGNQGYSSIRNIIIDKKAPVRTDLKISEAAYDAEKWFKAQTIGISGKFTDTNGSGVSKVWYQIKNDGSSNYNVAEYVLAVKESDGYTFTANASGFQDGINKLKVWAEDAAGNESSSSTEYTINIDTKAPEIATLDHDKYSNLGDDLSIEFTITDGINLPGTTASGMNEATGTDAVSVEINGKKKPAKFSSNKWTASFLIADLPTTSKSYPITVTATDKAGNKTESLKIGNLIIDKGAPTVTINKIANKDSPSQNDFTISDNKTIVNGNITVSGTAGDTQALKTLTVAYKLASAEDTDLNWTKKITTVSNTWTFDLDTTTALTDGQDYVIRASVVDEAGNSNTAEKTIHVSRDSDRPVIKFNNIDITKMYETGGLWIKNKDIYGSVTDDDGEVTSVQISYNYGIEDVTPTWDDCWTAENGLNFSTEGKDGPQNIYFCVKDVNNKDYITSLGSKNPSTSATYNAPDLNAPKIQYSNIIYGNTITDSTGSTLTRYSTVINAKIDLTEPTIPVAYYSTDNWGTYGDSTVATIIDNTTSPHKPRSIGGKTWTDLSGVTSSFGGDYEDIYIIVQASDVNGIKEIGAKFDESKSITGATLSTVASNDTVKLYRLNITNVTGSPTGTLILSAKDNAELSGERKFNISVDKDAPKVTIDSPSANTSIYGTEGVADANVTVRGKADNDAAHIFMAVTKYEDAEKATSYKPSNFVEITKSNALSWNAIFNGKKGTASENDYYEDRFNDWVDTVYRSGTSSDTSITEKEICLWFYAVDNLGNSGYETGEIEKLPLKILTQGDRPTVTISTPSNGGKVGGTITIAGSTSIAINSVEEVYVQIDPKSDSTTTFDELNWNTHLNNLIAGKTTDQLGYSLVTTGDNIIRQAVIASGSKSNWSLLVNQASEFNLEDGNRNIVVRVYAKSKNGKISDPVDCYFELDPNSPTFGQTESIVLSENSDGTGTRIPYERGMYLKGQWYLFGSAEDDSGIDTITCSNTNLAVTLSEEKTKTKNQKTIKYKEFSIPLSGEGQKQFTLTAKEQGGANTGTQQILVNFDNTDPTFDANLTSTGNQIVQTDGVYEMSGTFSDGTSGSGFERIAFYVTRTDNGVEYLTDIMKPQGQNIADNSYTTTSLTKLDGLYWKTGLEAAISNGEVTVSYEDTMPDYIRRGSLCRINGSIYRIETIRRDETTAPKTVTFTVNKKIEDTTGNTKVDVYFALAQVIDHAVTEGGYTEDYDADYDFDDEKKNEDRISGDDNDQMVERWRETTGEWSVSINSKNIKDGDVTIYFVAFDKAGNKTEEHYSGNVSNNAPRFAGVKFGTDTNGNDRVEENEMKTTYVGWYNTSDKAHKKDGITISGQEANGNKITKWAIPNNGKDIKTLSGNAVLSVKGNVKIVPEVVGGNNGLGWKYKVGEGTATTWKLLNETHSGGDSVRDADETSFELDIEELLNATSEDGVKDFTFTITDMTGSTLGDETCSKAELLLRFNIALRDGTAPTAGITPFYWEGLTKNSVYSSKAANQIKSVADLEGHIELEKDLPTAFTYSSATTSGEMDVDPKVSGIINLEGFAKDNVVVEKLLLKFPGLYDDFVVVAERDRDSASENYGKLKATTELNSGTNKGAKFIDATEEIVTEEGVDYNVVNWKIAIDTSKISTVAATDVVVMVKAQDRGEAYVDGDTVKYGKSGTVKQSAIVETFDYKKHQTGFKIKDNGEVELTSDTPVRPLYDTSNKTPYYKVDVVPYITGISTTNRTKSGLKDNNIRSASGKYSIMYAKNTSATSYAANFITVKGFNLKPTSSTSASDVRIVNSDDVKLSSITTSTGTMVRTETATSPYTSFTMRNTIGKSGYLEVFTNGIRSLNNINNNNAHDGNGAGSTIGNTVNDYKNYYNREADYNTTKNVQLTDDRYLTMWDMHKTNTKNGYYPVMIMEGNNPVFGYVDANGASSSVVTTGYESYYMPQRRKFNSDGTVSSTEYLVGGTTWEQMAMAKDSKNKYIQASVYNRESGSMGVYYDKYASYYWSDGKDGWQNPGTSFGQSRDLSSSDSNNALSIEGMRYGGLLIDRYQNLKLNVNGDTTSSSGAIISMAYFDDYYGSIIYRNFKIGTSTSAGSKTMYKDGNTQYYTNQEEISNNSNSATGRNTVTSAGSKYYDFAVTSDKIPVFVYYDFTEGRLRLMYSATATTVNSAAKAIDGNPSTTVQFCENTNIQLPNYVGQYVSMTIDSSGGIHISAFDANDSDLKYIYLTSYSATSYTEMTVDAAGSVGNWTNIKIDGTSSHPYYNKPVIAYYNATETGGRDAIKLAIANNAVGNISAGVDSETNYTSTGWEYMTVPSVDPAQGGNQKFQQVCLDFDSSGKPIVGYLATNLEFGKQLPEAD